MSQSQNSAIFDYLKAGNSITPIEALDKFGCFRLGARIWDLQRQGIKIKHETVTEGGKTFSKYSLGGGGVVSQVKEAGPQENQIIDCSNRESLTSQRHIDPPPIYFDKKNQGNFNLGI